MSTPLDLSLEVLFNDTQQFHGNMEKLSWNKAEAVERISFCRSLHDAQFAPRLHDSFQWVTWVYIWRIGIICLLVNELNKGRVIMHDIYHIRVFALIYIYEELREEYFCLNCQTLSEMICQVFGQVVVGEPEAGKVFCCNLQGRVSIIID